MAFEVGFFVVVYRRAGVREHIVGTPRSIRRRWGTLRNSVKWSEIWLVSCSEAPRASVLT